jgi:hypothetical protein
MHAEDDFTTEGKEVVHRGEGGQKRQIKAPIT